mmetsp:Transcript_10293/g.43801  ORF Transcript_10293/g.43801 Transcript_10293/m.43801 type:complete len:217 (+) Transcript_10293:512-1162(+)
MIEFGSGKSSCARTAASLSRCTRWCPFVIITSAKPRARACATASRAPGANTRCASRWPSNAVCAASPAAATAAAACSPSEGGTCSASARAHSAPRQAPTSTGSGDGSHGVRENIALKSASRRARSTGPAARPTRSESAAAAAAVALASATRASLASPSLPHAHAMFATCCDSSPPSFLCRSNHEPVVLDARADAAARAERSAEPSESESELSGPID